MTINQGTKANGPVSEVMRASHTWGLNVILYGLLFDIMYRSGVLHEAPWDLFALIGLSGAVSMAYAARHNAVGRVYGWRSVAVFIVSAIVAAAISFVFAMNRAR